MRLSKKSIAGVAAVAVAAVYSFVRWRRDSDGTDGQAPATGNQTPADD